ncbi:uncharacterized protein SPSK_05114 [Sporothrix schenckii 1099-18]|uniref:Uncharacterized protein n=1 Tax=Sporothrix schenckii 1099-18 TaxID=1397361 RepID=A0A0F2LVI6_SPOSC|nr:uncharacterized protein SPSK_05114 [Sporothrix schenckii 1099-18]KJR80500.1 hypothetical protein SPSK_05114 [Sporothrix schenckii 1099-18]
MPLRRSAPTTGAPASASRFLSTAWAVLFVLLAILPACRAAYDGDVALSGGRDAFLAEPGFAGMGLSPRYFLDGVAPTVERRDNAGCAAGFHSCLDINSTLCCANDRYCIIDPTTLQAACCSIGLTCGSPCNETQYECNATTTKTLTQTKTDLVVSGTATLPLTNPATNVVTGANTVITKITTVITTTSVYSACCARRCQGTSQFQCASSFGGGCCNYDQTCASNSQCFSTSQPPSRTQTGATATDTSGLVSALPSGCTTSQIACPQSLGGGCCALGHTCTVVSSTIFCASATGATTSGLTTTDTSSKSLSAGAKAGIAVGAVIGAAALAGAAAWACVRHRNAKRGSVRRDSSLPPASFGTHDYDDLQSQPHNEPQMHQPQLRQQGMIDGLGGMSAAASSPATRSWRHPLAFRRNTASTGVGGSAAAYSNSGDGAAADGTGMGTPAMPTGSEADARLPGLTQDYFGPNAVPGPYTVAQSAVAPGNNGVVGGVPMQPQGPHDIVAPVEIDSRQRAVAEMGAENNIGRNDNGGNGDNEKDAAAVQAAPYVAVSPPPPAAAEPTSHYELYGSEVPTPYTQQTVSPNERPGDSSAVTPIAEGGDQGELVVSPMENANQPGGGPRLE